MLWQSFTPLQEGNATVEWLHLGRIFNARGDTVAAKKIFRRALSLKPNSHPVLQEIRLLEMRERKGIVSRLLRR